MSQDNRPYNQLKHGSEVCDGTTNQTNRLSHQQRQDSTVNIFNIQLYTFIITFGKHKFIQKKKKWRQEYKNTKYDHDNSVFNLSWQPAKSAAYRRVFSGYEISVKNNSVAYLCEVGFVLESQFPCHQASTLTFVRYQWKLTSDK